MTRIATLTGLLLVTGACAGPAGDEVLVAAASDLAAAMPALAAAFEAEHGSRVTTTLGASGMLAQQIMNGAPIDVFMSADRSWVERLVEGGHAHAATRTVYARGALVVVTAAHAPPARDMAALADPRYARIGIANPQHAPYGRAARDALERGGLWSLLQPRLILAENVRQAYEYVASGNVDAALVAHSLVATDAAVAPVPQDLYQPLLQEAVVPTRAPNTAAAARFIGFLSGDTARALLRRHHFRPPAP